MTLADINWPLILAGLGLFLFGIDYMGDGLKSYAGDKLKDIIDKYTSSPVKGILIGALVTCLIQSSSGTTALTIGLIRSGLMNLNQAVGIIMGANIGTVITSVLVGLKISKYAVYFIIIGAFVSMFSNASGSGSFFEFLRGYVFSLISFVTCSSSTGSKLRSDTLFIILSKYSPLSFKEKNSPLSNCKINSDFIFVVSSVFCSSSK